MQYPILEINLAKLRHNAEKTIEMCKAHGIKVSGVVKAANGLVPVAKVLAESGACHIASSRLEQLENITNAGIDMPKLLLRVPMLSEAGEVVKICDISLQSELSVLKKFDEEAQKQGKIHQVVLMMDMGDLREGFWDYDEAIAVALEVENNLKNLYLAGIGTNLGCYGSIVPTKEKLTELVEFGRKLEDRLGRKLDIISGGGSTSIARLYDGDMPEGINHLRVGEHILLNRDMRELWGYPVLGTYRDVFTLKAEVIEVKNKPSYPVGKIFLDAFGGQPVYEDRGMRKRALVALGKVDYGLSFSEIIPRDEGVEVMGASSDHTILDVENAKKDYKVGDIIEFDLNYAPIVFTTSSANVNIIYKDEI